MTTIEGSPRSAWLPRPIQHPWTKRTLDLVVAVATLPAALLIALLCTLAIVLDTRGPVFFVQTRTGLGGASFRMIKFRTMIANAHEMKVSLDEHNVIPWPDFRLHKDPRVTRVGRWLRASGLDELPQIINVIRGDMSLVGPRPTSFDLDNYEEWHLARLTVLPGITGLCQVSARDYGSFDERVRYDLEYIDTMSLWNDTKILVRTIAAVFRREGR